MIERGDDGQARPQTLGNSVLIGFTLAPITSSKSGSDTDTRRGQMLWVDRQRAIARRPRLSETLRGHKESCANGPRIGILRMGRRPLGDLGVGRFALARVDRRAAVSPNRPVLRRKRKRLVIARDGRLVASETGQGVAETVPCRDIIRIGGQRAVRIRARLVVPSYFETHLGRDRHDNQRELVARERITQNFRLRDHITIGPHDRKQGDIVRDLDRDITDQRGKQSGKRVSGDMKRTRQGQCPRHITDPTHGPIVQPQAVKQKSVVMRRRPFLNQPVSYDARNHRFYRRVVAFRGSNRIGYARSETDPCQCGCQQDQAKASLRSGTIEDGVPV